MGKRLQRKQDEEPKPVLARQKRGAPIAAILALTVLAAGVAFVLLRPRPADDASPPDIILVTIDTWRHDAAGFSGNTGVATPFLDRLAREGRIFTEAHAHNVVTLPSHANILTGLLPFQHGIRDNAGFVLDSKHETVAEMLRAQGYATAAFVSAFPLDVRYGLSRGFDVYDDRYREGSRPRDFEMAERSASETIAAAREWYAGSGGPPRFLWLHLFDPHAPYAPPEPFRSRYRTNPYLGEVAYVDDELGKWLSPLIDASPETVVIVTGDHGEALGDHGELTHGLFAYESTLAVPLVVRAPGRMPPSQDAHEVAHIDVVPTILELAGAPTREHLPGRSLLGSIDDRETYFESLSTSLNRGWAPLVGIIVAGRKYIDLPLPELYDIHADPSETTNLFETDRRGVNLCRTRLAALAPETPTDVERKVSEEEASRLMSLGYVTGTAARKTYTEEDDPKRLVHIDRKLHEVVDLYQRGNLDAALAIARAVVADQPDMAVAREMLAFLQQESGDQKGAIAALEAAVGSENASDTTRIRLAMVLSESGRPDDAVEALRNVSAKNDPDALNALGIALADRGDIEGARREFEAALAVDPTNASAYQNLGVVALRAGDATSARSYLTKALALNDALPLALNTLGVIEAREQRLDHAVELWSRAVAIDPRMTDTWYNIALVTHRMGRVEDARNALQQIIDKSNDPEEKRKAESILSQLDRR